jgi:two-component system response regulator PilR (NtrC family)
LSGKILFVDDDADVRHVGAEIAKRAGYDPVECESGQEALRQLKNDAYDLIVSDMRMPNMNGIELLKLVKLKYPDMQFILVTGYASIQNAIQATREGADDYISKPYSPSELLHVIDVVISKRNLINENRALQDGLSKRYQIGNIIGASRPMQNVYSLIEKAARSQANVVIHGETGTGKELVARSIHYSGQQSKSPFLSINCGAIPENLLESELFGHVRGSFTGAVKDKPGLFETANDGTILLDEIGEMPLNMQVKLLRVLDDRSFRRVGDTSERTKTCSTVYRLSRSISHPCEYAKAILLC